MPRPRNSDIPDSDPEGGSSVRVGVDARALVPEVTGIGVYCRSVLTGLVETPGIRPLALAHAPIRGLETAPQVERAVRRTPSGVLWQQLRLNRQLESHGCDLLWSPLFTLPWAPRRPAVITVHDMTAWMFPRAHRLKVRMSLKPLLERSVRLAARVITPSQQTADDLVARFPVAAGKTEVIPHGVDPEFAPASAEAIAATRRRLGCDEGYFVYSGTLEPRKNVDALLDAWLALRCTAEAPPLILVGGVGWKAEATVRRLRALQGEGVHWLGRLPRSEQVEVVQAATAMVFPSLYEGFGLPPLEAMACAVPLVCSDRSSLPEVVGDAGLLVDPEDREQLAAAMRRLAGDAELARRLGERGRDRARQFTWTRSTGHHARVIRQVAAAAKR